MKTTKKQLAESIVHVLNSGCSIILINSNNQKLLLKPMCLNKKLIAECYYDEIWNKYIYNLDFEGVFKILKHITLEQIINKRKLEYCPIGSEEIVKYRKNALKPRT